MVFFPAALMHSVHPFYGTDEPRISIAGNLWYDTTGKGRYGNALDPVNLGDKEQYLKRMEGVNQYENWDKTQQSEPPQNNTFKVKPRKPRNSKKSKSKGFQDFVPKIKE